MKLNEVREIVLGESQGDRSLVEGPEERERRLLRCV
jgi:hypothetical protein